MRKCRLSFCVLVCMFICKLNYLQVSAHSVTDNKLQVQSSVSTREFTMLGNDIMNHSSLFGIRGLRAGETVQWTIDAPTNFRLEVLPSGNARLVSKRYNVSTTLKAVIYNGLNIVGEKSVVVKSNPLQILGNSYISCCSPDAYRPNYLLEGASLTWQMSTNIDIDSQKGDSIRISTPRESTGELWLQAVVSVGGNTYRTTKTLTRQQLGDATLTYLGADRIQTTDGKIYARTGYLITPHSTIGNSLDGIENLTIQWGDIALVDGSYLGQCYIETEGDKGFLKLPAPCNLGITVNPISNLTTLSSATIPDPINPNKYQIIDPDPTFGMYTQAMDKRRKAIFVTLDKGENTPSISVKCRVMDRCGHSVSKIYKQLLDRNPSYNVYPNPFSTVLNITRKDSPVLLPPSTRISILIHTDAGIIKSFSYDSPLSSYQLNLMDLPVGNYYLTIKEGFRVAAQQIIFKRR